MPRPCKRRRICEVPSCKKFGPLMECEKELDKVVMTLDEFECIRLIDLEKMNQEQCAKQMNVARTTVQAIYVSARGKIAECLVGKKELLIEGGDYEICSDEDKPCHGTRHCRCCCHEEEI